MIKTALSFLGAKRFYIYGLVAVAGVCFFFGGYLGWKTKGHFQMSANMKAIEKDLELGEEHDEIRNNAPDYSGLIDSLRNGEY